MKLYKPVKITSAEQAEALPIGTVAFETGDQGQAVGASVRVRGGWHCTGYCLDFGGAEVLKHSDMIGDTALVPIEAEEEWKTLHEGSWHLKTDEDDARRDTNARGARRRYTTDWEEA